MSSPQPTVSVVMAVLNGADALPTALQSVVDQDYAEVIEVIVAAGDPATAASAKAHGATVVENASGRTPAGLNLAITASRGDVVVRCDANSRLPNNYVSMAIETLQRTQADCVGGMQVAVGETPWERAIASAMSSRWGAGDARYRIGGKEGPAETVYLGVYRRRALEEVGGFDEVFARTQDYELNHRIIASGGLVWFNPNMRVEYRPRSSFRDLGAQYFAYGHAKRQFSRKHRGSLRWRQMVAPTLVAGVIVSLAISPRRPAALLIPATYAAGLLVAGLTTDSSPWKVAAALGTMHLTWGSGFLLGRR